MSYGYSVAVAKMVKKRHKAAPDDPVYALGALCIQHSIVPSIIAEDLDVSKQTIYKWFEGAYRPRSFMISRIETLIEKIKAQH